ncbi:hypothetical protein ACRAKI_27425 [Saccharothrix isguenensis]
METRPSVSTLVRDEIPSCPKRVARYAARPHPGAAEPTISLHARANRSSVVVPPGGWS